MAKADPAKLPPRRVTRPRVKAADKAKPKAKPAAKTPAAAQASVEVAADALKLTDFEAQFVAEYMIHENGTRAYKTCRPTASDAVAANEAVHVLRRPQVVAAIAGARLVMRRSAELDAEGVVRRLAGLAMADERELMEVRVASCRYCHGIDHRYHYTPAELLRAEAAHAEAVKKGKAEGDFDPKGGAGYNANVPPHPDCPECHGDGIPRAVFKDTRKLSEGAALLFAGVKVTKDGFEVKVHSRETALVNMARVHGLFDDKLKLGGKVEIDATEEMKAWLAARDSRLPVVSDPT